MRTFPLLGVCGVLLTASTAIADNAPAAGSRADVARLHGEIGEHMTEMNATFGRHSADAQKLSALYAKLDEKTSALRKAAAACASGCTAAQGNTLAAASKDVEQTQGSFAGQALLLQREMDRESRSYTTISNILRTKHDSVKNIAANLR